MEKGKCGGKAKCITKGGRCARRPKSHCGAKHYGEAERSSTK